MIDPRFSYASLVAAADPAPLIAELAGALTTRLRVARDPEVEAMQVAGDWAAAGDLLAREAQGLEAAGAECVVLCTNTMHKVADAIEAAIAVPLLHIVDVTAEAVRAAGLTRVALLGTRFTMEQAFLRDRLAVKITPRSEVRDTPTDNKPHPASTAPGHTLPRRILRK